jgi:hypothetical protein
MKIQKINSDRFDRDFKKLIKEWDIILLQIEDSILSI